MKMLDTIIARAMAEQERKLRHLNRVREHTVMTLRAEYQRPEWTDQQVMDAWRAETRMRAGVSDD